MVISITCASLTFLRARADWTFWMVSMMTLISREGRREERKGGREGGREGEREGGRRERRREGG